MILNSKNSNYVFSFPKSFLFKEVKDRYEPILKRTASPYSSLVDYLNASIQGITFPGIESEVVQQTLREDNVKWKDGFRAGKHLQKEFTVTFKSYEGYINYWIMYDQLKQFLSYDQELEFFAPTSLSFLDQTGFELINMEYQQVLFTGMSSLELSFSSNVSEFQTFDCTFVYNYLNVKRRLD